MSILSQKKIIIFGYGSQGRAQALLLKKAGFNVSVCLKPESSKITLAKQDSIEVIVDQNQAASCADVAVILIPDEKQHVLYEEILKQNLKENACLIFAHGFSVAFDFINPRADLDVVLVVPKCPGYQLIDKSYDKSSISFFGAVHQNVTGCALDIMNEYAFSLGAKNGNLIQTSFKEEAHLNLFMEQAVSCGGLFHLIQAGFDVLVKNGISPKVASVECLGVTRHIANLIEKDSLSAMLNKISPIARYGCVTRGPKVIDAEVKKNMQSVLDCIKDKTFAHEWVAEAKDGSCELNRLCEEHEKHAIEQKVSDKR